MSVPILEDMCHLVGRQSVFGRERGPGLPRRITDSQCGFKLYKGEIARELFEECQTRGYMFELEILPRALQKGYRIEEFPVEWSCDLDTRLRPRREAFSVLRELFRVRSIIKK